MKVNEGQPQPRGEVIQFPKHRVKPARALLRAAGTVIDFNKFRHDRDYEKKLHDIVSEIDEHMNTMWHYHSRCIDDKVACLMADAAQMVACVLDPDSSFDTYMAQVLDGQTAAEAKRTMKWYSRVCNCLSEAHEYLVVTSDPEAYFAAWNSRFTQEPEFVDTIAAIARLSHQGLAEVMPTAEGTSQPFTALRRELQRCAAEAMGDRYSA